MAATRFGSVESQVTPTRLAITAWARVLRLQATARPGAHWQEPLTPEFTEAGSRV